MAFGLREKKNIEPTSVSKLNAQKEEIELKIKKIKVLIKKKQEHQLGGLDNSHIINLKKELDLIRVLKLKLVEMEIPQLTEVLATTNGGNITSESRELPRHVLVKLIPNCTHIGVRISSVNQYTPIPLIPLKHLDLIKKNNLTSSVYIAFSPGWRSGSPTNMTLLVQMNKRWFRVGEWESNDDCLNDINLKDIEQETLDDFKLPYTNQPAILTSLGASGGGFSITYTT